MEFPNDDTIEWPSNEYVLAAEELEEVAYECLKKDRRDRPTMIEVN